MRIKNKEYIITYEDGAQKTFKTMDEIKLFLELSLNEIYDCVHTGESAWDKLGKQQVWIEELA